MREQPRDAVGAADLLARVFGLLDEDGEINTQACYEVIEDARGRGVMPQRGRHAEVLHRLEKIGFAEAYK